MKDTNILNDIVKKLCDALPTSLRVMKKDLEKNFRVVLQNALTRLDLVTREEFDAQTKVLARTRKKLESVEKEIKKIEDSLSRK